MAAHLKTLAARSRGSPRTKAGLTVAANPARSKSHTHLSLLSFLTTALDSRGQFNNGANIFPGALNFGQMGVPAYNYGQAGQPSADINMLTSGLPSLSVSSTSPSPVVGGSGMYPPQAGPLPYVMPPGFNPGLNFSPTADPSGSAQWSMDNRGALDAGDSSGQFTNPAYATGTGDGDYDDSDRHSLAPSSAPSLSVSSPNSMSPISVPSPGDLGAYTTPSTMSMASGQWSNTPLVTRGMPDPIEPFFKTLRERNLVRQFPFPHYPLS